MNSPKQTESSRTEEPVRVQDSPLMCALRSLDNIIGVVCRSMLYTTMTIIFFILSVNVGLRYIAGTSLSWASELPELLFPWMIMSGIIIAAQHNSHIAIVIITQRVSEHLRRKLLFFGALVIIALYGYIVIIAWPLVEIAHDEISPILRMPGSINIAALIFGFSLLVIVTIIRLPRILNPQPEVHSEEDTGGHS